MKIGKIQKHKYLEKNNSVDWRKNKREKKYIYSKKKQHFLFGGIKNYNTMLLGHI